MKGVFKWFGEHLSFLFKKWVEYVFRRRSIWAKLIMYWSVSLAYELSLLATDDRLNFLWQYLDTRIGEEWSLTLEIIVIIAFGNFNLGYSPFNIIAKLLLVIFFSLLQARKESNQPLIHLGWKSWKPTEKWFKKVLKKHLTPDIEAKYHEKLYEDQGLSAHLIKGLSNLSLLKQTALQKIDLIKSSLSQFEKTYQIMLDYLASVEVEINQESNQYQQLNRLYFDDELRQEHRRLKKVTKKKHLNYSSLKKLLPDYLEEARQFHFELIEDYPEEDRFIDQEPESTWHVYNVFDELENIIEAISDWDRFVEGIHNNKLFIHGNAGVGKSNLSIRLTKELTQNNLPVILIKGSSFRGSPDEFERIFKRELEIPQDISLLDIIEKLDSYGRRKRKRVIIIFDALNETTFENHGFSPIWRNSLDDFVEKLSGHPHLYFLSTLRTSYISRVWDNGIPYPQRQLRGFTDEKLSSVIRKYFEYYRITYDELDDNDTFYFRNPLMLDLYCKMLNPERQEEVSALLGLRGFQEVFENYLVELKNKIRNRLGLPSVDRIAGGINRCSDEMIDNIEAYIRIQEFYNLLEGKEVDRIEGTIGERILDGYLIYVEEIISDKSVVLHSQQQVGGYLLANRLLENYKGIKGVIESDFFRDYLLVENGGHQLKDDIIQFLFTDSVEYTDHIDQHLSNDRIRNLLIQKLQRESRAEENRELRIKLLNSITKDEDYQAILDASTGLLTTPKSPLRIIRLSNEIIKLESLSFDMVWTQYVYHNAVILTQEIEKFLNEIDSYTDETEYDEIKELKLELTILLLATTVRYLRDLATKTLIEFGSFFPEKLFENLFKYSSTKKVYIYERLAAICYGICLRKQNDQAFIDKFLGANAQRVHDIQFAEAPQASTYNYLVIDSYKHLIDLAIQKGVFELNDEELTKLKEYKFTPPADWNNASEEDIETVREITINSYRAHGPDPLRMDFVIYTISRLIIRDLEDDGEKKLSAVANIYRRILDLGYQTLNFENQNGNENQFFYGVSHPEINGKIDRLGKKYSWIAYFDYAGYLLNQGELDVWYPEEAGSDGEYQRLSDGRIEVSNTQSSDAHLENYQHTMIPKTRESNWTDDTLYETTFDLWKQKFDESEYTLLYGKVEEKPDESYDVRSYLMIEAFLVNQEDVDGNEQLIIGREFDWNDDLSQHNSLNGIYFGELYWADNVSFPQRDSGSLPLEEDEFIDMTLTLREIALNEEYSEHQPGDVVRVTRKKILSFEFESASVEYVWESESDVFPTLNRRIPSTNLGSKLSLRADTHRFRFLDSKNKPATHYVEFDDGLRDQSLSYLRSDLLEKYLKEEGLVLMYQIKQHSYDRVGESSGGQFRGMQLFFPHLK